MQEEVTEKQKYVNDQLIVHHRHPKSGVITKITPYLRHCSREHGVLYERGGKLFYENWEPVGPEVKPWFKLTTDDRAVPVNEKEALLAALEDSKKKEQELEEKIAQMKLAQSTQGAHGTPQGHIKGNNR